MTLQASGAISFSDVNTELGLSSTSQISMNDTAVRTLFNQASGAISMTAGYGKSNTSTPGAPTSVSASATGSSSASVSFSAPSSNGGLTIDYYQAISSPGCITATGTSPISVTGLSPSTSYTFRVRAHNSKGYGCYSSSSGSITTSAVRGCVVITGNGQHSWVVPAGVTSISALAVSPGASAQFVCGTCGRYSITCGCYGRTYYGTRGAQGGQGGALTYHNNVSVTPGQTIYICIRTPVNAYGSSGFAIASKRGYCLCGGSSYNVVDGYSPSCIGARHTGNIANNGGPGGYFGCNYGFTYYRSEPRQSGGGGGAGGYSTPTTGTACPPPRGGGAGYGNCSTFACCKSGACGGGGGGSGGGYGENCGRGGGGVGIYGKGSSGARGGPANCKYPGGGGSGGNSGSGVTGGNYGGGGAGMYGAGGAGVIRFVWPGNTRTFPSTDVGA